MQQPDWWRAKVKILGITLTWTVAAALWLYVAMVLWFPCDYSEQSVLG